MRSIIHLITKLILMVLLLFILSCAGTDSIEKVPIEPTRVTFATYQVAGPIRGNWQSEIKEEQESVKFTDSYTTIVPLGSGQKQIRVFKIPISKEAQRMSKEMLASGFMDQEHKILTEQFKGTGVSIVLKKFNQVTTISDKTVYYMSYEAHDTRARNVQEAILYLYVPVDFGERQALYGFLYTDTHRADTLGKIALDSIDYVISNFQLK